MGNLPGKPRIVGNTNTLQQKKMNAKNKNFSAEAALDAITPESVLMLESQGIDGDMMSLISNLPERKIRGVKALKLGYNQIRHIQLRNEKGQCSWKSVELMDLSNNPELSSLEGLSELTSMTVLSLACNHLVQLPDELWNITTLRSLDLGRNQLKKIPKGIGNLIGLQRLNFSMNQLTMLSGEIERLYRLVELDLNHNKLKTLRFRADPARRPSLSYQASPLGTGAASPFGTGTGISPASLSSVAVPVSVSPTSNRKNSKGGDPSVGTNRHSPPIATSPIERKQVQKKIGLLLGYLNVSHNQLETLPPDIGLLYSLRYFYAGHNRISSLPGEIGQLKELKVLDLRSNYLPSLIPEVLTLPKLAKLQIMNNQLTTIPSGIRNLTSLTHLVLSSNLLVELPSSVGKLGKLKTLRVSHNRLLDIPEALFTLPKIEKLDLSFNRLTYIPKVEPDKMPRLRELRLTGNKLDDLMPEPILKAADASLPIQYLRASEAERRSLVMLLLLQSYNGGPVEKHSATQSNIVTAGDKEGVQHVVGRWLSNPAGTTQPGLQRQRSSTSSKQTKRFAIVDRPISLSNRSAGHAAINTNSFDDDSSGSELDDEGWSSSKRERESWSQFGSTFGLVNDET